MKKKMSLSLPTPCQEKWEDFTTTSTGSFCSACQKNVIDFTKMSDQELMQFFRRQNGKTCGRFRQDQLKSYNLATSNNKSRTPFLSAMQASFLSLVLILSGKHVAAQCGTKIPNMVMHQTENEKQDLKEVDNYDNKGIILRGLVKDEYGELFPGVSIVLKGTNRGVASDLEGKFEFPEPLQKGDVLIISFITYETLEYVVTDETFVELDLPVGEVLILGAVAVDGVYESKPKQSLWKRIANLF